MLRGGLTRFSPGRIPHNYQRVVLIEKMIKLFQELGTTRH
jgi:hypothetical protein